MPFISQPTTLVVLTRDHLIRAAFGARADGGAVSVRRRERPESDEVGALVVAALGLERTKPGRVFVLAADFWTQTIDVETSHVAGVPDDEIAQLLNFEAEPISGLSAFESDSAAVELGEDRGDRRYWLTQIPKSVREQIDDAVRAAGGRLVGLAHPGGVPVSLAHTGADGARIEFWPAATVRTVYAHGRLKNAHIDSVSGTADWVEATKRWQEQCGPTTWVELFLPDHPPASAHSDESYLTLLDQGTLEHWLTAWREVLVAKRPPVPVLGPLARPMTQRGRSMATLAIGAVAALACVGHATWTSAQLRQVVREYKRLEAPIQQMGQLRSRATNVAKELKTVEERRQTLSANVDAVNRSIDSHRQRIAELMHTLSAMASPDWVLQKIEGDGDELVLSGTALHPGYADQLAEQLSDAFAPLAWAVDPPKQTDQHYGSNGGPWTFEIHIRDLLDKRKLPAIKPNGPNAPNSQPAVVTGEEQNN